jgi:hypothetical protein
LILHKRREAPSLVAIGSARPAGLICRKRHAHARQQDRRPSSKNAP